MILVGVIVVASVFLAGRLVHPIATILSIGSLFGISFRGSYLPLVEVSHWRQYQLIYACLVFLTLFEAPLVKYLPWSKSSFCKDSGGYPNMLCFRVCSYGNALIIIIIFIIICIIIVIITITITFTIIMILGKLGQSIVSVLVQGSVLAALNRNEWGSSCVYILFLSLASSVIPLFITGIEGNNLVSTATYLSYHHHQ